MYLASSEPATVGSLRYFNENKLEFAPVSCCSVVIHAARYSRLTSKFSPTNWPPWTITSLGISYLNSSFDITAEQYLSANKAYNNQFPVHPDTPRWQNKKPLPGPGKP
ncbi:hypothetical protein R3P38DRAFT_2839264, partial [Favolaschia claudopus]